MRKNIYALFTGITFVLGTVPLAAQAGSVAPDLQYLVNNLNPGDEVPIIVTLSDQADLRTIKEKVRKKRRQLVVTELQSKADKSQKALRRLLLGKKIKHVKPLWIFNGIAATVPAELIASLAARPEVSQISLDGVLSVADPITLTSVQSEWNINAIRAPELWAAGYTGAGVVVASMDTGVDVYHPDLITQYRGGNNSWYDPNGQHATPYDANGHGTQSTGVMVGGQHSGSAIGVAPNAQWIAVKIFNDAGNASYSNIHLGYQWLLDPDGNPATSDAPDIVNNSWGLRDTLDTCFTEFQPDIQALKAAQIAVVFAAGNEGSYPYTSISPANYPESLAVGSVNANLAVDSTSSNGPSACDSGIFPQLVAPGVYIKAPGLTYGGIFPNSYTHVTGTSFAAPHVAGAMALLLSAYPQASVGQLEQVLKQSALPLNAFGPNNESGYGMVDVAEAFLQLGDTTPPPPPPDPVCTDADGDGFFTTSDCGQPVVDCNDNDATVYPGAIEVKHDGIDQNCNGFDLTIDIIKAAYAKKKDKLTVQATSDLGQSAVLELNGFGPMTWNKRNQLWTLSILGVGGKPGTVTVTGVEGSESVTLP